MRILQVLFVLLLIVTFALQGGGQRRRSASTNRFAPELEAELTRVRESALESGYAYARLAHLTENIGPRLSGSPQAEPWLAQGVGART